MAEQPTDEERRIWHRRFAVEANNRAWALIEKPELTVADRDELLHTSYSSMYHWRQVGTDRNHALASLLLAFAHARLGHGDLAAVNAARAQAYFDKNPGEVWEQAFVHAAMAAAAAVSGDRFAHARHHGTASEIGDRLDPEEKSIFMAAFCRIPVPE